MYLILDRAVGSFTFNRAKRYPHNYVNYIHEGLGVGGGWVGGSIRTGWMQAARYIFCSMGVPSADFGDIFVCVNIVCVHF